MTDTERDGNTQATPSWEQQGVMGESRAGWSPPQQSGTAVLDKASPGTAIGQDGFTGDLDNQGNEKGSGQT